MSTPIPKGPFRDSIRVFAQECAEREDYTVRGMPIWCTLLVHDNRSKVVPLYTIEENVKTSEEPFCDQCRPTVGTVNGEHGTTTVLLVLDNVIVTASDSRISTVTDWIVKPHQFKVRKIRENPASVACYCGNIAGAENMLDHLEVQGTRSHRSLIRAASEFMKNNVPWESFACHLASIDPKPRAHLVVHEAEPQHVAGCPWQTNWNKCYCWDMDSISKKSYCAYRTQGLYCLGSGGSAACSYLASKYKWTGLKMDNKSDPNEVKMKGKLSMSTDEATNNTFEALLAAAFDDPSTGGPFKAYIMRQGETEVEEKTLDFLEACESYYEEIIKKYEDNSIFVVYPYHLQQNDCGKVVTDQLVKDKGTVDYLGHPLTWLQGRYTLHCITFYEHKHAVEAYLRGEQVESLPSFTRSASGIRYLDVKSKPKTRKRRGLISHTMYVAMVSVAFLRGLITDSELMKTL